MTGIRVQGPAFRAHNPEWAFLPTSGEGAAQRGGRFNPKGTPALYLSLSPECAIFEAMHALPGALEPMTLCEYALDVDRIADLTDDDVLDHFQVTLDVLSSDWLETASEGGTPPTWQLAQTIIAAGYNGIRVPAFASNAPNGSNNIALYNWGPKPPTKCVVYDPNNRLPVDQSSFPRHARSD